MKERQNIGYCSGTCMYLRFSPLLKTVSRDSQKALRLLWSSSMAGELVLNSTMYAENKNCLLLKLLSILNYK